MQTVTVMNSGHSDLNFYFLSDKKWFTESSKLSKLAFTVERISLFFLEIQVALETLLDAD